MSIYQFEMKTIQGKNKSLSDYKGKVLLLVNVASECGLTAQYKGLQELYEKYQSKGFEILAFPANEFGAQEPGSNEDIESFCSLKFDVSFPMFSKIVVKGDEIHPLYKYLTSESTNSAGHGEITWNFQKYLIDKEGNIIKTYHPNTEPFDDDIILEIEKAIN